MHHKLLFFVVTLICNMQWTIAAKNPIDGNYEGVGLNIEYCLPGIVNMEAKVISFPVLAFFEKDNRY